MGIRIYALQPVGIDNRIDRLTIQSLAIDKQTVIRENAFRTDIPTGIEIVPIIVAGRAVIETGGFIAVRIFTRKSQGIYLDTKVIDTHTGRHSDIGNTTNTSHSQG